MKKTFLLFLTAVLLCVISAFAQGGTTGPLTWNISGNTLTISGTGAMPDYEGDVPWYEYRELIQTVVIETGVTKIGNAAFWECYNLQSITLPNSLTSIGRSAFQQCYNLQSITLPNSLTTIGEHAFYSCSNLTSIIIPNNVTSIEVGTFCNCGLTSISIPDNLTSIGNDAFYRCENLSSITLPNNLTSIGNHTFFGCTSLSSITLPNSITSIGEYAFSESGLTSITIPNSVTSIGFSAFRNCTNLETVYYNAVNCTTVSIPFYGCTAFNTLNIGNQVKVIPGNIFSQSSISSVTIPNSVTSIGVGAFKNCTSLETVNYNAVNCTNGGNAFQGCTAITTIDFGNQVEVIPEYIFAYDDGNSNLTTVTIGNSVKSIGEYVFMRCYSLHTVNFNAINCTTMGSYNKPVFYECTALTTLNIGNDVKIIPDRAFAYPSINSVTMGNSVKSIGDHAFAGCGVTSITIPSSVTSMEEYAFVHCSSLHTVNFNATNCTTMGAYNNPVFYECTAFTTLNIGSSVKSIPSYAFQECHSLTSVAIPNSVISVGDYAFNWCDSLSSVKIGNSVKSIGVMAFYSCGRLSSVTMGNSVKSIGFNAFCFCWSLQSITLPNSIINISGGAFWYCPITSITLSNSLKTIEISILGNCSNLTSVIIPSGVTDIAARAFINCTKLSSVKCYAKTPPAVDVRSFENVPVGSCVLKVPTSAVTKYKQAEIWKDFIIQGGGLLVYPKPADPEKGFVNGNELYEGRATATVEAFAHNGYHFVNWTKDGVVVSTANPYSFTVTEDVELVANFDGVGIVSTTLNNQLQVYPNPTTGELTIDISDMRYESSDMRYEIFDIYGRKLSSHHLIPSSSNHQINISHLPAGIYFVKVGNETVKVVKQ